MCGRVNWGKVIYACRALSCIDQLHFVFNAAEHCVRVCLLLAVNLCTAAEVELGVRQQRNTKVVYSWLTFRNKFLDMHAVAGLPLLPFLNRAINGNSLVTYDTEF